MKNLQFYFSIIKFLKVKVLVFFFVSKISFSYVTNGSEVKSSLVAFVICNKLQISRSLESLKTDWLLSTENRLYSK